MNVTYFDPNHAHAPEGLTQGFTIHWNYIRAVVAAAIVILSIIYLILLNGLATQGFDMESLKAQQIDLYKEIETLDISLAIPSSIYALESNEMIQNLPLADNKAFFAVEESEFAMVQ